MASNLENSMNEIKCPNCNKVLSEKEIETKVCRECGCLFTINSKATKAKKYSSIIKDTRKMNYRFWIKFFIFFLILWAALTVLGIVVGFINSPAPWNWIILVGGIILYIVVFVLIQFLINLTRDVYLLKEKVEELENNKENTSK